MGYKNLRNIAGGFKAWKATIPMHNSALLAMLTVLRSQLIVASSDGLS